jgi:UDP-2,3-diacylglucosamine pyrophosphatase LpxH
MKKITCLILSLLFVAVSLAQNSQSSLPKLPDSNLNIIVANDMGYRGVSEQQNIANLMGKVAAQNKIAFMAILGDPINDDGVKSVDDEEWNLKIENIYTAPSLYAMPWYVIAGNHEYNGNVQAIIDYSQKSERWNAPARYYSQTRTIAANVECLFVFIDTPPLIDKLRTEQTDTGAPAYSDAGQQDMNAQLEWLEQLLASSQARWKIVFGHHPVYAETSKSKSERKDMQARVAPILEKYGVTMYVCGHIHNFQHLKPKDSKVEYIVNSSASESREVKPIKSTIFCNPDPGFSIISISADRIEYYMENHEGKVVYDYILKY